jgi:hypothetical protein
MKNRKAIISRAFQAQRRDLWLLQRLVAKVVV